MDDEMDEDLPALPMGGNMNLNNSGFGDINFDPNVCITDPGKHLFSPGNAIAQQQQTLRALIVQQNIENMPIGEAQKQAMLQRIMLDEHKPFKCPVVGCEKAYKNQNGLK